MRPSGEWLNQADGLAERLYGMRKAAGLTGDQLARQLGWPRSKISKLENGRQMPAPSDITAWARECGHPEAERELLDMLADAQIIHRQWKRRLRDGHTAIQQDWDLTIRQAAHVRNFESAVIPGLLQTAGYARQIAAESMRIHGTREDVDAVVAARMRRQEALYDTGKTFEFVTTEMALRLRVGPPAVVLAQLDRLLSIRDLPSVTFGVIPLDAEISVIPLHGFTVTDNVVSVETFGSEITVRAGEAAIYSGVFERLMAEAVTGSEIAAIIRRAMEDLR